MTALIDEEIRVRLLASARGLRLLAWGRAWRIVGPSVDFLVADLRDVHADDLRPPLEVRPASVPLRGRPR